MADDSVPAGEFSAWLAEIQMAMRGEGGTDVPCGGCTACCTSSQFIHIEPHEHRALAAIPKALVFPAPLRPKGHMLMGYDEHGRCPMLIDNACSIYADRPQTCRTYDCRVFAAAELDATDDGKPEIAQRARRWDFSYADENARTRQAAVAAAAAFVRARRSEFPEGSLPPTVTHLAVLAVRVHEAFLNHEGDDVRLIFPSVNDVVSRR